MATQEVDEVELLRLRKQDQTVHALMANPVAKKKIFEAYKTVAPDARIPELEIEEAARKPVADLEERVAKLTKQIEDDKAESEKRAKLDSLSGGIEKGKLKLRQSGWTDEGIAAVEKVMEDKGIVDVEVAAAYYEKQHPPQVLATPRGYGGWDFAEVQAEGGDAYTKALLTDKNAAENDHLVLTEATKALNEFRGQSRR